MSIAAKTKKTGRVFECVNTNASISGVWDSYFIKGKKYIEYEPPTGTNTEETIAVLENTEIDKNCFLAHRDCFKLINNL